MASNLTTYLESVYALERSIGPHTISAMRYACLAFQRFAPTATVADLSDDLVSRWVRQMEESSGWSARTIFGRRADVLTLWRFAYERGDCDREPSRRVRKVRVPQPVPRAWTVDELSRIVAACRKLPGVLGHGVPRRLYFPALVLFIYESGLRRADALRLRLDWLRPDGSVVFVQSKTGRGLVRRIRLDTLAEIQQLSAILAAMGDPRAATPFAWPHSQRMLYWWLDEAKRAAGVDSDGALQQLRRTGATHCERAERGSAAEYLGHMTPGLAAKHYIDPSQAYGDRPLPPALGAA